MNNLEILESKKMSLNEDLQKIEKKIKKINQDQIGEYISEFHKLKSEQTKLLEKIKEIDVQQWAKLMGPSYVRMVNCPTGKCSVSVIHSCCDDDD